jgi:DNA-binding MarR family transcriptional regulator
VASPHDGRAQTLALTAQGTEFVPELAAIADQNEAECFAHLSEKDRRALERILKETAAWLGPTSIPID